MEKKLIESQEVFNVIKSVYNSIKYDYEYDAQRLKDYKSEESPDDEMILRYTVREKTYQKIFDFLTDVLQSKK